MVKDIKKLQEIANKLNHTTHSNCVRHNKCSVGYSVQDKINDLEKRLKDILIDRLNVEEAQIRPEASFVEDLGADSLDIVELIMGIEEEFNIEISDDDAEKLTTVGEALAYIKTKTKI